MIFSTIRSKNCSDSFDLLVKYASASRLSPTRRTANLPLASSHLAIGAAMAGSKPCSHSTTGLNR